ncbi:MAG TPA: thioredoxin domain-containing protein [Acidobacteriota bacterium]|nr:thioredoxin domain-containing protein [Acidobacteriota bacterium]
MNRLAGEKSPYLLQHAANPVDWHPWSEEAFERARREDKPVFLSVGYSTCHWCHVMERESFADEEVARALNGAFICIKVDREERPDIDRHYMAVCQALTGSGGWPLTIVMTPERRAFFAGTYFPKERRWGRPGLLDLVPLIQEAWRTRRMEVLRSAGQILEAVDRGRAAGPGGPVEPLSRATLDRAFRGLRADFDEAHCGFGGAPRFPLPHRIAFLLRYGRRTGNAEALAMAGATLEAMRRGGLYDQIGFGFHRYSTDVEWRLPHFEKMLYDQALLAEVYAEAFLATGKGVFRRTAAEVADYVLRDLAAPGGGFYAAEDADSEGEEGRFYLWTMAEIREALGPGEAELASREFQLEAAGNFTEPGRGRDGRNILYRGRPDGSGRTGPAEGSGADGDGRLAAVREKLFRARAKRPRPFLDTKVLADWNGLMIAALASVHRITGEARFLRSAADAAGFVLGTMVNPDGRLRHVSIGGEARVPAFLDDYAFFVKGLIALYEAAFDPANLERALDLTERSLALFWDEAAGGFFAEAGAEVGTRSKEIYDGAVPSGNSVMFANLSRLGRLTGRPAFEEKAVRMSETFSGDVASHPPSHAAFLCGLDFALGPTREVVVTGKREGRGTKELLEAAAGTFLPNTVILFKPVDEPATAARLERLAPFTKGMDAGGGTAAAYVCSGGACLCPVTTAAGLREALL